MEAEEKLEDFKYEIAFNNICYNIKEKKDLSENSKIYIDWAKTYFKNIVKSLNSILKKSAYFITPHLKEVIECTHKKNITSLEEIIELNEEIKLLNKKLDKFKSNPQKFYKTKDSEEVFNFINKLKNIFEYPSKPIMTCCSEDIEDD